MAENAEQIRTAALADDAEIWRPLLKRAIPMIYGLFVRRGLNPGLAEELVQQTAFDAVRGRASFDAGKGTPEQWMLGIARNNLALEMRKRATRPSLDGDISTYLASVDTAPLPDEVLEKAVHSLLYRARNSLREKLKTLHPLNEEETK